MIGWLLKLRTLPLWLWIALGLLLAGPLAMAWHGRAVGRLEKSAFDRGVADERARAGLAAARMQRDLERQQAALARTIREKNDATRHARLRHADDLRLRGPGKAGAQRCPRPADTERAGRPFPADGFADARLAQMPSLDGTALARLPWDELVKRARTCDDNRAEVIAWRSWWAGQKSIHETAATP